LVLEEAANRAQRETAHLQQLLRISQREAARSAATLEGASPATNDTTYAQAKHRSHEQPRPYPIPLSHASDSAHPSLRFEQSHDELAQLTAGAQRNGLKATAGKLQR
jgi:hypothetical protein